MIKTGKINICQPGNNASCALCCGSHNYKAPIEKIRELFKKRADGYRESGQETFPGIHDEWIQCRHVGFINSSRSKIGCLLYHDDELRDLSNNNFQNNTCKNFFCLAGELLSSSEIIFASKLMGDWFYYSLLIHEVEMLKGIMEEYGIPGNIPPEILYRLKKRLEISVYGNKSEQIISLSKD